MFLGFYDQLHAMLVTEFGDAYTDDNAVVLTNSEDQATIATLWVIKPDTVKIVYEDERPDKLVFVLGARPSISSSTPELSQ